MSSDASNDPTASSDDIVLIDRTATSRSSSILGSSAAAINTIVEEGDSSDDDVQSIEIDVQSTKDEEEKPPRKRLSFAPDPVQYRTARMEHVRTSRRGSDSIDDCHEPSSVTAVEYSSSRMLFNTLRRFTSVFASSSNNTAHAHSSSNPSDSNNHMNRRRRNRTTIFTRGSATLSVASSVDDNPSDTVSSNVRQNPCIKQSHYDALRWWVEGRVWKYTCYIFIFIMLFGSQIQELWLPKAWDLGCDVVFSVSIVVLTLDIVLQSIVDPLYFSWRCGKEKRNLLPGQQRRYSWLKPINRFTGCNIAVGSFTFWCDVIGTLTFFNEIEYINPLLRSPIEQFVTLSPMGIPVSGLHREMGVTGGVGNPGLNILVAIGRAARMGRFIRTTVIVEYAARLNLAQYFYPRFWYGLLQSLNRYQKKDRNMQDTNRSSNSSMLRMTSGSNLRVEKEAEPHQRQFFQDLAAAIGISKQASEEHVRRSQDMDAYMSARQKRKKKMGQYSRDSSSHVGAAMRELTGQRVAVGVMLAILLNVAFTYKENDGTPVMTMILLHGQTRNEKFANKALNIARSSVVPNLFTYQRYNETDLLLSEKYQLDSGRSLEDIRVREILNISISSDVADTYGMFDNRDHITGGAMTELVTTIFILVIWVVGVTAFAGPVMTLVVEPIERMVALLGMLMRDPLGYQNSEQYKILMEEEKTHHSSNWENDVLKGMETSFLMSTIIRIGSLMQVGFGSAGTEIIRSGLERGRHKDVLFLNKQGSTVSCIFLFCDIRSFTDATECLQEEVFVFTNKIAAVVHSICHSYGGSANKNIGDAFLVSWLLDERPPESEDDGELLTSQHLYANSNQADKALLSVVKISIALYHDSFFVDGMSDDKKTRLISKFNSRHGPLVQMGFGLHAGKAVQGAIGSTKKLDATYISESVERAEMLESNTKKYGCPLLMSDAFYNLLDPANKYRCRKVDQILLSTEDDPISDIADVRERIESGEKMNLYTYDMDIAALFKPENEEEMSTPASSVHEPFSSTSSNRRISVRASIRQNNRSSIRLGAPRRLSSNMESSNEDASRELDLPTGPREYDERCWLSSDIKKIRRSYVTNGVVFPMFESGLIAFYGSQWEHAKHCFEHVLTQMDDGPAKYFLNIIEKYNCVPPPDFIGYGLEE